MKESKQIRRIRFRWRVTIVCAIVFALFGFSIGCLIDTKHPNDRIADILYPTLVFLVAGLQIGYVSSLVLCKRFTWFDAIASFALPPLCFFGFVSAKSGSWRTGQWFGLTALAIVTYLVWRFVCNSKRQKASDLTRLSENGIVKNDGLRLRQ